MGGDLNLKKSWNPVLQKNQEKTWLAEKKALEERKRIDQMMRERQEERQMLEIQQLQEAAGGKKRLNRVDWMYSGPSSGQLGTTEEMEGYLLGKRRIDGLIKGSENQKLEKAAAEDSFMALQNANTARDTAAKIREDPMLAIKKQEQAAYEAMMNDPRRNADIIATDIDTETTKIDGRDIVQEDMIMMITTTGNIGDDMIVYPALGLDHQRDNLDLDDLPHLLDTHLDVRDRLVASTVNIAKDHIPHNRGDTWHHNPRPAPPQREAQAFSKSAEEERAAKLAAMQQNANELDQVRASRLAAADAREKAEREADEAARARTSKDGGKGAFLSNINKRAGELDLSERLQRGRRNVEKEQEAY
ncbi:hypothetical protein ZTR_10268 [Talaromyces verruculosus]|nr:hypothetical protein ZTR_10268 [Talaromyces verruculosus]